MTTIAYKNGVLAGDAKISSNDTRVGSCIKVWKNYRGDLLGVCGSFYEMSAMRDWFMNGAKGEAPQPRAQSEGLLIKEDGSVYSVWGSTESALDSPFHAMGSGFELALGAMAAGATAEEAVEIACAFDNGSGGPIFSVKLDSVIEDEPDAEKESEQIAS